MNLAELKNQFCKEYKIETNVFSFSQFIAWEAYKKCAVINNIISADELYHKES